MKKTRITETLETIVASEFDGPLSTLKVRVDSLISKYGPSVYLDYDKWHTYPYDRDHTPVYDVKIDREETNDEYAERIQKEEQLKIAKKEQAFKEIERLRKEYGDPPDNK